MFSKVLLFFSNQLIKLQFAIIILLLIAIFSMLGTVIEQNQDVEFYEKFYSYSLINNLTLSKIIIFLGLNNIYNSLLYFSLIICLSFSLILCSFKIQYPSIKLVRILNFQLSMKKPLNVLSTEKIFSIISKFSISKYQIFSQGYSSYLYKGFPAKISPLLIHLSLILILFGCLLSFNFGAVIQEMIPEGEVSHIQNIFSSGIFSEISQDINISINKFSISYYNDQSIQQFYSNISLLDNWGKELLNNLISVNRPLRYSGFSIYQTDWRFEGIRINYGNDYYYESPVLTIERKNQNFWYSVIPINRSSNVIIWFDNLENSFKVYSEDTGNLIISKNIGEFFCVKNTYIVITDKLISSGVQIKSDPGLVYIYRGFFILLLSLMTNRQHYTRISICVTSSQIFLYKK
uniref:C-type cytochrome biogenensis protein n=1 Tax=Cyanidium sp. THAL103 TaxID=3027999 RepID=A0A9Y1I468_9RHOD|nr:c-type cytochrome biogenensis protein [Cyanidium sp. THAL103]